MESKSKCVVASLVIAFIAMLFISAGVHAVMHGTTAHASNVKSFVAPGAESAISALTVVIWGVVAGVGGVVKTAVSYLMTHHR